MRRQDCVYGRTDGRTNPLLYTHSTNAGGELNTNNIPKISSLGQMVQKLKKCQKLIKGQNFVKNVTFKNPKPHAHLQIEAKHSAKFQINLIKDIRSCGDKVGVSKGHNSIKWPKQKSKTTCTSSYHKKTIYEISN